MTSIDELSTGLFLQTIETPAVVTASYIGHALYTTPDVLRADTLNNATSGTKHYLSQLEVADVMHKDFKDMPVSKMYIPQKGQLNILSPRHMRCKTDSAASCDSTGIFVTTNGNRKHISVEEYAGISNLIHKSTTLQATT